MLDREVVDTAIENIKTITGLKLIWIENTAIPNNLKYDGSLLVTVGSTTIEFLTEIKQEVKANQLYELESLNNQTEFPFLVIAKRLSSDLKAELRNKSISYIEANGNMYVSYKSNLLLYIDGQPPIKGSKAVTNRAFTKTGLKVVFHLLAIDQLIDKPYREIAATAGVALGSINYIFAGLKDMGFLLQLTKEKYKLTNKKALLDRWIIGYAEKLKPALKQGEFGFTTELRQKNWRELAIREKQTYWAGEPGGDLLTDHLRPELFTIYTDEASHELIQNYKLTPKENGEISIYTKFWNLPEDHIKTAPPLVIYADLITINDKRCRETAQIIYDKYIQPNL